MTKIKYS